MTLLANEPEPEPDFPACAQISEGPQGLTP